MREIHREPIAGYTVAVSQEEFDDYRNRIMTLFDDSDLEAIAIMRILGYVMTTYLRECPDETLRRAIINSFTEHMSFCTEPRQ